MLIKQKSLVVALASSFIISLVLVLTLLAYLIYIGLKSEESKRSYQENAKKNNARFYSKYLETVNLDAEIAGTGALKGKPVIEGSIRNSGYRDITDLFVKVKFLDSDNAVIYEVAFHPQEPALGTAALTQVPIPYLNSPPSKVILKSGEFLSFKKILANSPREIIKALQENKALPKNTAKRGTALALEILAVAF